jgi:hypothetical protein
MVWIAITLHMVKYSTRKLKKNLFEIRCINQSSATRILKGENDSLLITELISHPVH